MSDGFNDCLKQASSNDTVGSLLEDGDVAVGPFGCGVGGLGKSDDDGSSDDDDDGAGAGADEVASDESGAALAYRVPSVGGLIGAAVCGVVVLSGLFVV